MSTKPVIVLLDEDYSLRYQCVSVLMVAHPEYEFVSFGTYSAFLHGMERIVKNVVLVITEDRVGLIKPQEKEEEIIRDLAKKHPEILKWDSKNHLNDLLCCLDIADVSAMVLVYTHSERDMLDEASMLCPHVSYLMKEPDLKPLIAKVTEILATKP